MRLGAHGHYLGAWDAAVRLRVRDASSGWRAPTDDERARWVTEGSADADVPVLTLPKWLGRELEAIEWAAEDGGEDERAREHEAFARYGERVVEFFRFAGVALPASCEARLVATTERERGERRALGDDRFALVANVGDAGLRVALGGEAEDLAVVLRPGEACVVPAVAAPYAVALADEGAEFGLHLELDG